MARRGIGEGLIGLGQGLLNGYMAGRQLRDMAAERALKKQQFELEVEKAAAGSTVIDPTTGKEYRSTGIGPEARARFLDAPSPSSPSRTGKLTIFKPAKPPEPETTVTRTEFDANPEKYRNVPNLKVLPTERRPLSLDQRANLELLKGAYKKYIDDGKIPGHLQAPVQAALKGLNVDLVPEEDQGWFYTLKQKFGGGKSFELQPGKPETPGQAEELEREMPDGKIAVFDAKTKAFIRYK